MVTVMVVLGALIFVLVVYIGASVLKAWLETKAAPREEMFLCNVHGPIPQKGVIRFMDTEVCGICFHSKMQSAERGNLNG